MHTLITPGYAALLRDLHAQPRGFGASGRKHADRVLAYATDSGSLSILDYGCGQGTLGAALRERGWSDVREYDPAVAGKEALPEPACMTVCTDVLEHVEPEHIDAVLAHLRSVTLRVAFVNVCVQPAHKVLADGRNAHLIVEGPAWWMDRIIRAGWRVLLAETRWNAEGIADVTYWLSQAR